MWGEFLDHEWYYDPPVRIRPPEPWRRHRLAAQAHLLERGFVWRLAQPERIRQIRGDGERLEMVRRSLARDGLREPLQVVVDERGHLALRDGHHRLLSSDGLWGFDHLPVCFVRSQAIGVRSQSVMDLIDDLIRART